MLEPKSTHDVGVAASTSLPMEPSREIKDGEVLAGDDFFGDELIKWFLQEKEAYYSENKGESDTDNWYGYMRCVNQKLGFSKITLREREPCSLLVLGPGSGIEVDRFASDNSMWSINFLEASDNFKAELRNKYPQSHLINAMTNGDISLASNSQDVVCAFSVLHHIPNVSHVIREVYRVMKPGGLFLVREPCSSMGDWRFPRAATPNERGLSVRWLIAVAKSAGFKVETKPIPILFYPLRSFVKKLGFDFVLTWKLYYLVDRLVSSLASMNDYYWRDCWYKKFGPSAYFYVLRKRTDDKGRIC